MAVFIHWGVVIFGLDDTIERQRGDHIQAQGIYRDPVRSSHSHVVKVSGLRLACVHGADSPILGQSPLGVALSDGHVSLRVLL